MMRILNNMRANKRKVFICMLIVLGFMAMELPGILIVRIMIKPFIFGFPFLYVYMGMCWIYMCSVMFYGYKTAWGREPFFKKKRNAE